MANLESLPFRSVTLLNRLDRLEPPFYHAQVVVVVQLENGIRIEAFWDHFDQLWTVVASRGEGAAKLTLTSRTTTNYHWLRGIVRSLAWSLDAREFDEPDVAGDRRA